MTKEKIKAPELQGLKNEFKNLVCTGKSDPENLIKGWKIYQRYESRVCQPKNKNHPKQVQHIIQNLEKDQYINPTFATEVLCRFQSVTHDPISGKINQLLSGLNDDELENAVVFCLKMGGLVKENQVPQD